MFDDPGLYIRMEKVRSLARNLSGVQDLIISRALVEMFSNSLLAENLAFRGGTALFKLHMAPLRYPEYIDLVQALLY